ncbi:MAG: peptidoglycan glycosyltransferase [Lachnospiraceae bacterium]|nr:peptidoglycan glycosyltransferase [Lachnospiraceae bacterium]
MNKKSRNRLAVLLLVTGLLLAACIARAAYLVVENGSEYHHRALAQATGSATAILARPGSILDANGVNLATVRRVYRLILDPKVMKETEETYKGSLEKTAEIVAEAFALDRADLVRTFRENESSAYIRYAACPILSEEEVAHYNELTAAFEAEKKAFNEAVLSDRNSKESRITARVAGVWFEEEYRREYPQGDLLSKVIGYTTKDASAGILGLEYYYNDVLHGTNGRVFTYVDTDGVVKKETEDALDGYTLVTSLDTNVASVVRNAIREFMEEIGGKRVNVLVMNPNTGEILCMESDTEFDLNNPSDLSALFTEEELAHPEETFLLKEAFKGRMGQLYAMSEEDRLQALLQQVQMNFAVSGTYEPGSTAKTLTLATGFEEGLLNPEETFYCDGAIGVGNYTIHCHMDTLCGNLRPIEALARSCNVCLVQIGARLGATAFSKYQEVFNLGQRTGIDLPGEANTAGLIYYGNRLGDIELATCSFGQGFNVTMVQMAAAYSSIVNGGYYYEPHVVTKILDSAGNTVSEITPTLVRRTISEETSSYLKTSLRYVTQMGTATSATTFGYYMGGKTGASEKLPRGTGDYVVSFIGATPIEQPRFLVYAVVDTPNTEDQSSSIPAQILAKKCFDGLYTYFNVYSAMEDDAYEYDWANYRNSAGESDAAGGESDVDDPNHLIRWIEDNENLVNERIADMERMKAYEEEQRLEEERRRNEAGAP